MATLGSTLSSLALLTASLAGSHATAVGQEFRSPQIPIHVRFSSNDSGPTYNSRSFNPVVPASPTNPIAVGQGRAYRTNPPATAFSTPPQSASASASAQPAAPQAADRSARSPRSYAPPVHIAPVETQKSPAPMGLQDRLARVLSRNEPEANKPDAAANNHSRAGFTTSAPRQLTQSPPTPYNAPAQNSGQAAARRLPHQPQQYGVAQAPHVAVERAYRTINDNNAGHNRSTRPVRQVVRQEPIHDPFGDRNFARPARRVRPAASSPRTAPRLNPQTPGRYLTSPRSNRLVPKQVSILSRNHTQEPQTPNSPPPRKSDPPRESISPSAERQDAFASTATPSETHVPSPPPSAQDSDRDSQSDFDFDADSTDSKDALDESSKEPSSREVRQETERREDLRERLDALMEETENDLRSPSDESEEQDGLDDLDSGNTDSRSGPRSLLDLDDETDEETSPNTPLDKSCDEFRNELLDSTIRDIPLDMSPPASDLRNQYGGIGRSWTDRMGNVIATGAMVDLRRGYVILDSGQKIAFARLSDSDLAATSQQWRIPNHCSVGNRGSVARNWAPQTYTWTAASLCHKPLYFENIQLERYGHSHGPFSQPVHSVAHFFVSLATLPYQTAISPANECEYSLGLFRPGDCAPWLQDPIPISLDGMRRQAFFATGLAIIP